MDHTEDSGLLTDQIVAALTKLPTDNLYKLRALIGSGVFALSVVGGSFIAWKVSTQATELTIALRENVVLLDASSESRERAIALMEQKRFDEAAPHVRTADSLSAIVATRQPIVVRLEELYKNANYYGTAMGVFAFAIAFGALFLTHRAFDDWQRLHQTLQDRLLTAHVEAAELEVAVLRARVPSKTDAMQPVGERVTTDEESSSAVAT
ncbi:MAG: hypothetical protein JNL44_09955 [Gemmatimonadetes bacterium]|nr:hypothetical protein [Gemmatimonadota bacterium]